MNWCMWYSSIPAVTVPWRFRSWVDLTHVFWLSPQGKQGMSGWGSWYVCLLFAQVQISGVHITAQGDWKCSKVSQLGHSLKDKNTQGFCYFVFITCLCLFGTNSDKVERKHKAAFVLPALQVTAFSKNTFRCIKESKEIMFLEITVRPLFEHISKNRNKSKLKQRYIWSKLAIYEPFASDAHLTRLYRSIRKKRSFTLGEYRLKSIVREQVSHMKWHLDPQMNSVGKLPEDMWHKLWNDSNKKEDEMRGMQWKEGTEQQRLHLLWMGC